MPGRVFVCTDDDLGAPRDALRRWWWEHNEPPAGIRRNRFPRLGFRWVVFCRVCGRAVRWRTGHAAALDAAHAHLAWHGRHDEHR